MSSALSNAASASNSNLNHPSASGSGSGNNGGGSSVSSGEEEEVDDGLDTEIDIVVDVPIPIWTAPTHTVHPVFINHKLKWSAFIKFVPLSFLSVFWGVGWDWIFGKWDAAGWVW